jgi:hypothetical protein
MWIGIRMQLEGAPGRRHRAPADAAEAFNQISHELVSEPIPGTFRLPFR